MLVVEPAFESSVGGPQNHEVLGNPDQLVLTRHKHRGPQFLGHHLLLIRPHASDLGQLDRPGKFYDFTRYRPEIRIKGDVRSVRVPNTKISFARHPGSNDIVLLELLEPHAFAEDFNDSVIELLKVLNVTRYLQLGGMYDSVPHSR